MPNPNDPIEKIRRLVARSREQEFVKKADPQLVARLNDPRFEAQMRRRTAELGWALPPGMTAGQTVIARLAASAKDGVPSDDDLKKIERVTSGALGNVAQLRRMYQRVGSTFETQSMISEVVKEMADRERAEDEQRFGKDYKPPEEKVSDDAEIRQAIERSAEDLGAFDDHIEIGDPMTLDVELSRRRIAHESLDGLEASGPALRELKEEYER